MAKRSAIEIQQGVELSTKQYDKARDLYRLSLAKFSLGLFTVEVVVIGFALQNVSARIFLSTYGTKYWLFVSMCFLAISLILDFLSKRFNMMYFKYTLDSWSYEGFTSPDIDITIATSPPVKVVDAQQKSYNSLITSMQHSRTASELFRHAELLLLTAVLFALAFSFLIVVQL